MQVSPQQEADRKTCFAYLSQYQPFFAHLLYQQLEWVWTDQVKTAATDGSKLMFNPAFWDTLQTNAHRVFVIAHEIMHNVLQHPWRLAGRNHKKFNVAGDFLINDSLKEAGVGTMPPLGLWHHELKFSKYTTEAVYEMLPDPPEPDGGCEGDGKGKGKGKGKGTGTGSKNSPPLDLPDNLNPLDDLLPPEHGADDPLDAEGRWKIAIAAARDVAKMRGHLPGNLESLINDVLAASVNWKERLREWVQTVSNGRDRRTYMRPNRRFEGSEIIIPGWQGDAAGTFIIAIDTSGSVSDAELAQFKGEIYAIMEEVKPQRAVFIYCDASIQMVEDITGAPSEYQPRFVGRGGTSFDPPFKWVEENNVSPEGFIYFTDGECPFPKAPGYPVFWAITNTRYTAPWGTTVHVKINTERS